MCPSVTGQRVGHTPEENMEVQSLKDRVLDEKKRKGGKSASVHTDKAFIHSIGGSNQQLARPVVSGPEPSALRWLAGISLHQYYSVT